MCRTHYTRWWRANGHTTVPFEVRFWRHVDIHVDGCWLWTGWTSRGYGRVFVSPQRPKERAHRVAYELLVGDIPDRMTLDHLCRVRNCVRPDHLEMVTQGENTRRATKVKRAFKPASFSKTHCPQGHEYTDANVYRNGGKRFCRACRRNRRSRTNK